MVYILLGVSALLEYSYQIANIVLTEGKIKSKAGERERESHDESRDAANKKPIIEDE